MSARSLRLCLVAAFLCSPAAGQSPAAGVVVESVGPAWSGAQQAGLTPGDVITGWAPPGVGSADTREVRDLAAWLEIEAEHAPRADGIRVVFTHNGESRTGDLRGGAWMLTVAPRLEADLERDHQRAARHAAQGEQPQAAAIWRALAAQTEQHTDSALAAWFSLRAGAAELAARNAAAAQTAFAAARAAARERGQVLLERDALDGLGQAHQAGQQPAAAEAAWTEAEALMSSERPTSPAYVRALTSLATFQREFGRVDESQRTAQRALDAARAIAPGSIVEAAALGTLSTTLRRRGDLAAAERLLGEAESLLERFPHHPDRVANAGNRGILLVQQNRFAEAEHQLRFAESLDRARGAPPDALALRHHGNLGVVAAERGDFTRAEGYFRSFLEAAERIAINPLERVRGITNLALVAAERGDDLRAVEALERAHALAAKSAPRSISHADALLNLGTARARVGDDAGSTVAYEQALAIRREVSPDDPTIAAILSSLAGNAERRRDLQTAAGLAAQAIAHVDRTAPGGLLAGRQYHVGARIALARGDNTEARRLQDAGLGFVRAVAPGSPAEVTALALLARIDVADGRLETAADRYADAVGALGRQVRRLGAMLDREAGYVDEADVQRPYIDVLLRLGRTTAAFEALERFRGQALLSRLASRDLAFGRTGEAADLAREQRQLARAYDRALADLARQPATADRARVKALVARLGEIRAAQALAASNLRRVDPELAADLEPLPLTSDALRQSLPEGTLALAYHLSADRSVVFAVTRERLRVAALAASEPEIAERVGTWRRLIDRGRTDGSAVDEQLADESRALYRALVAPIEREIAAADRVVIVPDGVLHGLSFAALLVPPDGRTGQPRYLAEWKPLSTAPSLTTRARLAARPPRPGGSRGAAVFGDAAFEEASIEPADPGDRAVRVGVAGRFDPLPASRREAERIAAIFERRAELFLGRDATEEAIKHLPRDVAVLHVATHGVANDRSPLESALVLTASAGADADNGLLQAWEIFDQVRIDADLVVLSACDTGLGRSYRGEGLLGLTRAFQFAGARAVAASLWKAPDDATAALMTAFHRELGAGRDPDDALARAQRALLASPATRHPFFWAAFIVDGAAH